MTALLVATITLIEECHSNSMYSPIPEASIKDLSCMCVSNKFFMYNTLIDVLQDSWTTAPSWRYPCSH